MREEINKLLDGLTEEQLKRAYEFIKYVYIYC